MANWPIYPVIEKDRTNLSCTTKTYLHVLRFHKQFSAPKTLTILAPGQFQYLEVPTVRNYSDGVIFQLSMHLQQHSLRRPTQYK